MRRLLAAAAVLTLAACGSSDGTSTSTSDATTSTVLEEETTTTSAEVSCADLREQFVSPEVAADFEQANAIREQWDTACRAECGDLVEDTDTEAVEAKPC